MDSLYKKFQSCLKQIFKSNSTIIVENVALNINISRDGYDTLVNQGIFLKNN